VISRILGHGLTSYAAAGPRHGAASRKFREKTFLTRAFGSRRGSRGFDDQASQSDRSAPGRTQRLLFVLSQNSPLLPSRVRRDLKSAPTVTDMTKLRATRPIGLGFCSAMLIVKTAAAQMPLPAAKPPDGATLFKQQCATCHATNLSEPVRQGPPLFKIVGRRAGTDESFHYSAGFAKADFIWDDARLDAWLTNPQEVIPGAVMAYRQSRPETRATIIAYLKELN
jgi:cytochrome c